MVIFSKKVKATQQITKKPHSAWGIHTLNLHKPLTGAPHNPCDLPQGGDQRDAISRFQTQRITFKSSHTAYMRNYTVVSDKKNQKIAL